MLGKPEFEGLEFKIARPARILSEFIEQWHGNLRPSFLLSHAVPLVTTITTECFFLFVILAIPSPLIMGDRPQYRIDG